MWGGGQVFNDTSSLVGSQISVGTGITPATRQDVIIEAGQIVLISGNGGYNSGLGKIDIPASLISGSNFSLSETGLFGVWRVSGFQTLPFLLSRDNIAPVVSVSIAQTINVDYQLLLS